MRGLDVFGGYFLDGRLYLMGEIGTPFEEDWIFPLGTCTLAGRTLPAPARPEKLLEATYGPGWKVPDPAFHFETPRTTYRRLNGWFRGGRVDAQRVGPPVQHAARDDADRCSRARSRGTSPSRSRTSPASSTSAPAEPSTRCGSRAGASRRSGLDFAWGAANAVRRAVAEEGVPLELGWMSLQRAALGDGLGCPGGAVRASDPC